MDQLEQEFIGQRVQLQKGHPHDGYCGHIKDLRRTAIGKAGFVVELDDGIECFVFKTEQIKFLGSKRE